MSIVILDVDLDKDACSIVGADATGAVVHHRSMRRQTLIDYVSKLPACVVAMEACCGAHHMVRLFAGHGNEIRPMSPEYVRPYVKLCAGEHNFTNHEFAIMQRNSWKAPIAGVFFGFCCALFVLAKRGRWLSR